MQLLVFILAYPLLRLVSWLPFRLLYALSDGVYFLVYRVIGYRKKVVRGNLDLVFPEKSETERRTIEKQFYKHMCDMFLEMIKTMGMSQEQLQQRFTFTNLEVLHAIEAQNKSVMLMFPHYASWEWSPALGAHIQAKGYGIYQPIVNKYFDQMVRNIRSKFGATLITTKETASTVQRNKEEGILATYGILSDQSPQPHRAFHWTEFMGIKVPVHTGAEMLCKKLDLPAVFLKVKKLKRGHYQGSFVVLAEDSRTFEDYAITDAFLAETEKSIREAPQYYFWTHKRWKHRNKVPEAFQ